ncbi:Protein CBR-INS-11 [Caenorhabditis briggsae]|uniref:Uncharacterized protein n=2 Tax=Caenorhabditis briggsae TaxID=6238 RepID=A0AAE9DL33_CAEBR|nr:Protein CBR-INS-11 [Caenorhabditis briggsae]ULU06894.1 hypothetical protein L3Y34_018585 [Caenorhabditis briggsae]UMM18820.1 hypothetical protein L5515_014708 [Caenorhabditis briggsae]CAP24077.1 Protein CBR-INS-11 [Caenorhabditis briggsae]
MFQRFSLLSIFFFLALFLIVDQVNSAPHKQAACEMRLFKTLNTLCNHSGDAEVLQETAMRCCRTNCVLTEMMTACTLDDNSI